MLHILKRGSVPEVTLTKRGYWLETPVHGQKRISIRLAPKRRPLELSRRTHLGPYRLISRLGRGGMGEVFEARDIRDDRPVAVKVLLQLGELQNEPLRRFRREVSLQQGLFHPNLVKVLGSGEEDGFPFLVLELIEGSNLAAEIERAAPFPVARSLAILDEILAGLEHLHLQGVTHRDLKPQNVLLTAEGTVKIADFGLARAENQTMITRASEIVGTVTFMSPEVIGGSDASSPCDLYAAGLIFYQMVTGRHPYQGTSLPDWFRKICEVEPDPPEALGLTVDPRVTELMMGLLRKSPDFRFTAMGARERIASLGSLAEAPPPPLRSPASAAAAPITGMEATRAVRPVIRAQAASGALASPLQREGILADGTGEPDDELMARAVAGDGSAFDDLVRRHQHTAWVIAHGFFGDPGLAEDVVQEAFLKVFIHAAHYQPRARFVSYLRQVVTRHCLDVARRRKLSLLTDTDVVRDGRTSPSMKVARFERNEQVKEALRHLPAVQRMAVILRYFEGLPHAEIAEHLDSTEKAVERLLSRARRTLLPALRNTVDTRA